MPAASRTVYILFLILNQPMEEVESKFTLINITIVLESLQLHHFKVI